ncbi:TetR family transcriptional regulator [Flavobacteriaceae bacterium AU392]|nr:TetR/AcrR family transcriptional regulator [Flavobacteriaceae bacterium]RKM83634.1 TetR family transcriptional regulator [Flavobacteriaceae bacterium AU392]
MKTSLVRENIINIASTLFYQNGYNLTGINEIIEKSGIAKATLYNHFKSKDDLCIAFLQNKNEDFLVQIKKYTSNIKNGPNRVLALFDFLKDFFNQKEFNGCWCINTVSEIPKDNIIIKAEIKKLKFLFLEFIESLISENISNLKAQESTLLAKQIYLLYEGAVAESHLHNHVWPIESAQKLCIKLLE